MTSAIDGGAWAGLPSGTSPSMSKTIGMAVTGTSMITVPDTAGVRIRRNRASLADSRSWRSAAATTRIASSAGPPFATAVMPTPMNAAELPMTSTWPPPILPNRVAWSAVVTPLIATAANTAHAR